VLPANLPQPGQLDADDARLIAVAVDQNPSLAALARQVAGRRDAVELAKAAFLPNFVPAGSITGCVTSQNPVNFRKGIPAMSKQEPQRVFASWQRFRIDISAHGRNRVESYCFFHGALLFRTGEKATNR
jgi:hypothetical protein